MPSSNYLSVFIKQTLLNKEITLESASFLIDGEWVKVYNPTLNTLYHTSTPVLIVEGYVEGPFLSVFVDASRASAFYYKVKKEKG